MSAPSPPQIRARPKATDGTLEFWWGPPVSDGGSAILSYTIDIPGVYMDTVGAGVGYYKINGLTNGTPYTATLVATNANGISEPATFRTVEPGEPPSAPQTQAATRSTATSTAVSWTAPASDGGATVGWNVVSCYPLDSSGAVVRGSTLGDGTALTIPDLSANTVYTVLVRARNDPGYSPKAVYIAPLVYGTVPTDVSGLKLWLDAADLTTLYSDASGTIPSTIETSAIRLWKDKSGLGHDASGAVPARRINAGTNGNRYPCVQFANSTTFTTSAFSPSSTNTITAILVGQVPNLTTANQYFYNSSDGSLGISLDLSRGTDFLFQADGGNFLSATSSTVLTVQTTNDSTVISEILNPTYSSSTDSRNNTNSFNTSSYITIGLNSADVRLSELLIWDHVLSSAERTSITTYLQKKWGLPLSLPSAIVYLIAADLSGGDTTWVDRSGNGWDATLAGGSSTKNGSNALVLDGSSYWTFGDIGQQSNFSMSVWFKRTAASGEGGCIVTEAYTGGTSLNMAIFSNGLGVSDTQFVGGFFDASGWQLGSSQTFDLNTWVQMTVTWDGTDIKTYINGALVDTTNYAGLVANSTGLGYNIGKRWDNPDYVTGHLGEVRIDGVALTAFQVSNYYTLTTGNYNLGAPTFEISLAETAPFDQSTSLNFTATQTGGDSYTYVSDNWLLDSSVLESNTNLSLANEVIPIIGSHTMTYEITTTEFSTITATNSISFTIKPLIIASSTNITEGDTVNFSVDLTNNGDYNNDYWYINDVSETSSTNGSWSYQFNAAGSYSISYGYQNNTTFDTFYSAAVLITVNTP